MSRQAAFTVMELLMVLALLSILASVSLPALHSWQRRIDIDRANSALVELIGEAKLRAVRDGHAWSVRIDTAPARLTLLRQEPHSHNRAAKPTDSRDVRTLPASMQIEFYRQRSDEKITLLTVNSTGNITPAKVGMKQAGQWVQSYEVDRLTGGIRRVK